MGVALALQGLPALACPITSEQMGQVPALMFSGSVGGHPLRPAETLQSEVSDPCPVELSEGTGVRPESRQRLEQTTAPDSRPFFPKTLHP